MRQFIAQTQNPEFKGKLCGVQFQNGQAVISELTIDKRLGHTVDQVVKSLKEDFGHTVQEHFESGQDQTSEAPKRKAKKVKV